MTQWEPSVVFLADHPCADFHFTKQFELFLRAQSIHKPSQETEVSAQGFVPFGSS
jgi:hypothetical protein